MAQATLFASECNRRSGRLGRRLVLLLGLLALTHFALPTFTAFAVESYDAEPPLPEVDVNPLPPQGEQPTPSPPTPETEIVVPPETPENEAPEAPANANDKRRLTPNQIKWGKRGAVTGVLLLLLFLYVRKAFEVKRHEELEDKRKKLADEYEKKKESLQTLVEDLNKLTAGLSEMKLNFLTFFNAQIDEKLVGVETMKSKLNALANEPKPQE